MFLTTTNIHKETLKQKTAKFLVKKARMTQKY